LRIWQRITLFCLGGGAYCGLELLWRGRSHSSMFLLGGLCFSLIGWMTDRLWRFALWLRMVCGAAMVTVLELGTGLLVNRDYSVWDYRDVPYNYRGQICLSYSLLWIPVTLMAMGLYRSAKRVMQRGG